MSTTSIWLHTCLSVSTTKIRKLKITFPADDYDVAFDNLCKTVNDKMLKLGGSGEESKPEMVYKKEDEMSADESVSLEDADDLEGMLDQFPDGKGVRVIITVNDLDDVRSSYLRTPSAGSSVTNAPVTRAVSMNLKTIYEALRVAARKPGRDEMSYFVNPSSGRLEEVRLADFQYEEGAPRGGDSSYGKVFVVRFNDMRFAIKKIDGLEMDSDRPSVAFEREMTFLRKTTDWNCGNIVQFHGFIRTGETARLILELMDQDLSEVITSLKNSGFYNKMAENSKDLEDIGYIILRDISNGLRYTHGKNPNKEKFMHRDIKSSNIMVKAAEYRFAIIDFGTTKKITREDDKFHTAGAGQRYYEAPECAQFKPEYCESCDIWSLGITLIKFITGKHPIWDETADEPSSSDDRSDVKISNEIHKRITGKGFDGEKYDWPVELTSDYLSPEFKRIVNACVRREAKTRPTAQKLYEIVKDKANRIDPFRVQMLFETFFGGV